MSATSKREGPSRSDRIEGALSALLDLAHQRRRLIQAEKWERLADNARMRDSYFSVLTQLVADGDWPPGTQEKLHALNNLDAQAMRQLRERTQLLAGQLRKVTAGRKAVGTYLESGMAPAVGITDGRFINRQT